jgi:hypothetical protein
MNRAPVTIMAFSLLACSAGNSRVVDRRDLAPLTDEQREKCLYEANGAGFTAWCPAGLPPGGHLDGAYSQGVAYDLSYDGFDPQGLPLNHIAFSVRSSSLPPICGTAALVESTEEVNVYACPDRGQPEFSGEWGSAVHAGHTMVEKVVGDVRIGASVHGTTTSSRALAERLLKEMRHS